MPLPMETSPYQTNRLGPREDLLLAMHQAERLLILGEPGAGKTVALQRLAWELCGASEPAIPIFLALAGYSGGPLTAWVRDSLESTGHLQLESDAALHALLQSGTLRCFLLGDGLDELDPAHRDAAVAALTEWMEIYPHHPVILSSRPRSPVWRRLRDAMERVMILAHLSNEQIRTTLAAYLGRLGVTIHDALTPRQRLMARTPLNLWLMAEAGKASEPIPDTIAGLYHTFAMRKLRADLGVGEDVEITPPLNWRALADLAHTMGARRHCTPEAAVRIAARSLGGNTVLADAVIETCVRQGLLAVRQGLLAGRQQSSTLRRDERPQKSKTGKVLSGPKEKTLAFAPHPMMQAYFAARALHTVTDQEWSLNRWQRLKRKVKWLLTGQKSGLPALAADDVWWDPFVQLAGLTDRPDRLIEDVMHGNPWLALRCTEEAHRITRETLEAIQTRAVWHLDSEQVTDRRRAVATLSHITLSRRRKAETVQPLLSAAADSDPEVAGLAVQTLVALGEDVRAQTLALARQPDHALHRAGLAYLTEILGIAVVWVPPGPFLMGSELAQDPQAYSDELHRHRVTLPGYWIGRYPVTVAQFRIFLAETGRGDAGHRLSGPDTHPMRLVAWHEARAYCRWLSERTGWSVTLPSEAEWEKAARGTDGRLYPWGNAPPNATLCNAGNRWGDTTPVGTYSPQGDSPYGCADMAGNVWEWTRSLYRDYPYNPDDGRENPESSGGWVLRGGAFSTLRAYVRCAYRFGVDPNDRYLDYGGFRIVVTPS
jgi:formylglycine-generating enzyme required for sulfatase activity